jgi:transposase
VCVFAKRLEKGRFAGRWERGDGEGLHLTVSEFALLLEGSELVGKMSLSPPPFVFTTR